jgi:hypothetical protein
MLEKAGMPVRDIRRASHRLDYLARLITIHCEIQLISATAPQSWVRASTFRALSVAIDGAYSTVGALLEAENAGASRYPNAIRYGRKIYHFPPQALIAAARALECWSASYYDNIRLITVNRQ